MEIITKYKGINIIKSCGYYYPEVNGDIECKSIKEVKDWIDDVYLVVKSNMKGMADRMRLPEGMVWNTFISIAN